MGFASIYIGLALFGRWEALTDKDEKEAFAHAMRATMAIGAALEQQLEALLP